MFCGVWETPCIRTVGAHRARRNTHTHSPLPLQTPPQGLIFVRVCDSREVSTHPSSAARGEGEQVSLCHREKERKTERRPLWNLSEHLSRPVYQLEWNEKKIKDSVANTAFFLFFFFWSAAGCVKSITSASWLLKNEIKLVLFSGSFSCERRDTICWRRHKLTINTSPSLFRCPLCTSLLFTTHSHLSSPCLCPIIKTHVSFNGVDVFRVEAEIKILDKEMFPQSKIEFTVQLFLGHFLLFLSRLPPFPFPPSVPPLILFFCPAAFNLPPLLARLLGCWL